MKHTFLHTHPYLEHQLGLDNRHVIIDAADWKAANRLGDLEHLVSANDKKQFGRVRNENDGITGLD